ncbi:MAG: holin [Clostridia bacterium]|nr:holin [Clostridia bacterium]
MDIKQRLRSPAVWAAFTGALGLVLEAFGVFRRLGIDSAAFDTAVGAVCAALTAFGILNNPTDRENF